jgi:hypothetical protein
MIQEWYTLPMVTVTAEGFSYRAPDTSDLAQVKRMARAADNGNEMLCLITRDAAIAGGAGSPKGKMHGRDERGQGKALSASLRGRLIAEARRLGAGPDWTPEQVGAD